MSLSSLYCDLIDGGCLKDLHYPAVPALLMSNFGRSVRLIFQNLFSWCSLSFGHFVSRAERSHDAVLLKYHAILVTNSHLFKTLLHGGTASVAYNFKVPHLSDRRRPKIINYDVLLIKNLPFISKWQKMKRGVWRKKI